MADGEALAEAYRGFRTEQGGQCCHALRQQHDHGAAVVEPGHLGKAFQCDPQAAIILGGDPVAIRRDLKKWGQSGVLGQISRNGVRVEFFDGVHRLRHASSAKNPL